MTDRTRPSAVYDDTGVDKYEMSDADYAARRDSVRAFKQTHKLGRFNADVPALEPTHSADAPDFAIGQRCRVISPGTAFDRRGSVQYVGETVAGPGVWVGVRLDMPLGKNDGRCVTRACSCSPQHPRASLFRCAREPRQFPAPG